MTVETVEELSSGLYVVPEIGEAVRALPRERYLQHVMELMGTEMADVPMRTFPPTLVLAAAISAVEPVGVEKVVQVGAGLGWSTYLLAQVAESVVAWERHAGRAEAIRQTLETLGVSNVVVRVGDGLAEEAVDGPLEAVLVSARYEIRPQHLIDALVAGSGRLVRFVAAGGRQGDLERVTMGADGPRFETLGRVPLHMRLGDLLVSLGELSRPALEQAAAEADLRDMRLGEVLREQGQEVAPEPELAAEVFPEGVPEDFQAYRGKGCGRCGGRGMRGRVAVVEYLEAGPAVRKAISKKLSLDELRAVAVDSGLSTLRTNGLRLVEAGTIPFEELGRIFSLEQLAPPRRA